MVAKVQNHRLTGSCPAQNSWEAGWSLLGKAIHDR